MISSLQPGAVPITYNVDGAEKSSTLKLNDSDLAAVRANRYVVNIQLHDLSDPRRTTN